MTDAELGATLPHMCAEVSASWDEYFLLLSHVCQDEVLRHALTNAISIAADAFNWGNRLWVIGNGGSCAHAQHLATELSVRFERERSWGLPAIALPDSMGTLTASINDYNPVEVFARQIRAHCIGGDVLVVFTTSGFSPNINEALLVAKGAGLRTIGFLGRGGGSAKALVDVPLIVTCTERTCHIQDVHQFLLHRFVEGIDAMLFPSKKG